MLKEEHQEAVGIYLHNCKVLGYEPDKHLDRRTVGKIWDFIIRDLDLEIKKEFGDELKKIGDKTLQAKIKGALGALYDDQIFVRRDEARGLFACCNDNAAIEAEYRKLGGTEKLLVLEDIDKTEKEGVESI
jgi:hypothetical protein